MKGRCIGVSLCVMSSEFTSNNKIEKSLPGVKAFFIFLSKKGKKEAPQCICRKGSLTVEAAVILPLLACFFAFLLFYFRIMQVQLSVQNAMEESGRNLAIMSVQELENAEENDNREVAYLALAKTMMYLKLKEDTVVGQYVSGGAAGVSLLTSEFDGDYILLRANYALRFPVKLLGQQDFLICQKTRFRKWTGWHSIFGESESEKWVYVTEYGQVYHSRMSCPYLDLTIQKISWTELAKKRNGSGKIYDRCERCGEEGEQLQAVYITKYGECYHFSIDCSSLKRTIYQKRLSEVGGMGACTKCSK